MMSLPFLAAKLPLGSSIAVKYNEQSKIQQVTISKSSQLLCEDKYCNIVSWYLVDKYID